MGKLSAQRQAELDAIERVMVSADPGIVDTADFLRLVYAGCCHIQGCMSVGGRSEAAATEMFHEALRRLTEDLGVDRDLVERGYVLFREAIRAQLSAG